jgi:hypothetical protein
MSEDADGGAEGTDDEVVPPGEQEAAFEALLDFLKESRGFDFTGYKRSSIWRRVTRRMQQVGTTSCRSTRTSSRTCSTRC